MATKKRKQKRAPLKSPSRKGLKERLIETNEKILENQGHFGTALTDLIVLVSDIVSHVERLQVLLDKRLDLDKSADAKPASEAPAAPVQDSFEFDPVLKGLTTLPLIATSAVDKALEKTVSERVEQSPLVVYMNDEEIVP